MCKHCDEQVEFDGDDNPTKALYEGWLKEQEFEKGVLHGAMFSTGMVKIPEAGILILQKTTERSTVDKEGVTDLPDAPIAGILISEDEMESFIIGILYQMGPDFILNMMRGISDD